MSIHAKRGDRRIFRRREFHKLGGRNRRLPKKFLEKLKEDILVWHGGV